MLNILANFHRMLAADSASETTTETTRQIGDAVTKAENSPQLQKMIGFFEYAVKCVRESDYPAVPTQQEMLESLCNPSVMVGIVVLLVGLFIFVLGGKFYKLMMSLNTAAVAALLGGFFAVYFGQHDNIVKVMLISAVVFGLLAWPLVKVSAGLFCAGLGAAAGTIAFEYVIVTTNSPGLAPYTWAGGIIGAVLMGLLGFMLLPVGVRIFTALEATIMVAAGAFILMFKNHELRKTMLANFEKRPDLLLTGLAGFFLIGFAISLISLRKKRPPAKAESDENAAPAK